MQGGVIPRHSFAKFDFGIVPKDLPELTPLEKVAISTVLVHRTALLVQCRITYQQAAGNLERFSGHIISFETDQIDLTDPKLQLTFGN